MGHHAGRRPANEPVPMPRRSSLARTAALLAGAGLCLSLLAALPLPAAAEEAAAPADLADRLAPCAACHGAEGRTVGDTYYPSIAGKPARYLYNQLVHFRDGRRQHAVMAALLATLSDRYLGLVASHYAAQPHAKQPAFEGASAEQLALGERLTVAGDSARQIPPCQDCHGERLTGVQPSIPGLRGLPTRYLEAQVSAWKQGVRHADEPDCMGRIARRLEAAEITAISAFIASQPYAPEALPAASLPGRLPLDCGGVLP